MASHDPKAWMLSEAVQLLKTADRLQSQFFRIGRSSQVLSWEPPVDMYGGSDELGVLVAMPGVEPGRYQIILEHEAIVVQGERALSVNLGRGAIIRLEIPYGRFERRIQLPYGGYRIVESLLENGCLRVHLERVK